MSFFRNALASVAVLSSLAPVSNTAQAADYQRYQNGVCAAGAVCNIDFPNVPVGKTLTLSNVSCYLRYVNTNDLYGAQLLLVPANGPIVFAVTTSLLRQNGVRTSASVFEDVFVSNDTVFAVAKAGQHFRAYAEVRNDSTGAVGTISQYACHISGTLLP